MPIPRPLATAAPSRVGPVVALIALAAILLPSPSARAQTTYDLQGDQWKARGEPDPASPEGQLLTIRRHLAADEPREAEELADEWIAEHRGHPGLAEAYVLRGDAKVGRGRYYESLFDYELVARVYPGTEQFNDALQREYEVGLLFLGGVRRRLPLIGLPILPAYAEGEELMIRIQERAPGSEIGERASLALADYYFADSDMGNAQVAFESFLRNYPRSAQRERALLMLIRSLLASFKGPRFDSTPLAEALQRIDQYRREFPVQAQTLGLEGIELRVRESLALKAIETARWYDRTGKDVSAAQLHRRILKEHAGSAAADESLRWLTRRGLLTPPAPAPTPDTDNAPGSRAATPEATP